MPFNSINIADEISKRCQENSEFNRAWKESREEYRLIGEMISLRKKQNISQGQLADMIGNKQQVISRVEKKENSPSLKLFCCMLNALGYELQIVKKEL